MASIITNPEIIYTAKEFIEMARLAEKTPSCYVTGCFGAPLDMPGVIDRWEAEYPKNEKYDQLMRTRAALAVQQGTHCFGFDCVNLIKSLLWKWDADGSQEYGGAVYQSNGVPDTTVDGIFDMCTVKSDDFSKIKPGAMLYMNNGGHCGIYIGGGFSIEATGSWERKIYMTAVANLTNRYPDIVDYEKKRTWQKWGLLPWIDYEEEPAIMAISGKIICPCCGKTLSAEIALTLKPEQQYIEYTVQENDTPWGIARKFFGDGSKYYIIMDYNNLPRDSYIYTGQILKVPVN